MHVGRSPILLLVTGARELTNVLSTPRLYALSTRVSRYPRRRVVEERAVEDIDEIIPTSRPPSRIVPAAHAISGRPRRPFGTSLSRLSVSFVLRLFSTRFSRAHLPRKEREGGG